MRLTVGNYLNRTPGILGSVAIAWQKDYPWEIAIDSPEKGNDKHMLVLPHVLDVTMAFTPVHNFIPQKSITEAPFILPHWDGRDGKIRDERKWLKHGAGTVDEASSRNRYAPKATAVTAEIADKFITGENYDPNNPNNTKQHGAEGDFTKPGNVPEKGYRP